MNSRPFTDPSRATTLDVLNSTFESSFLLYLVCSQGRRGVEVPSPRRAGERGRVDGRGQDLRLRTEHPQDEARLRGHEDHCKAQHTLFKSSLRVILIQFQGPSGPE